MFVLVMRHFGTAGGKLGGLRAGARGRRVRPRVRHAHAAHLRRGCQGHGAQRRAQHSHLHGFCTFRLLCASHLSVSGWWSRSCIASGEEARGAIRSCGRLTAGHVADVPLPQPMCFGDRLSPRAQCRLQCKMPPTDLQWHPLFHVLKSCRRSCVLCCCYSRAHATSHLRPPPDICR